MEDSKYEICPLAEADKPNGIVKIDGEVVDYVVIKGRLVLEDPNLDPWLIKKISRDLKKMLAIDVYKIVEA